MRIPRRGVAAFLLVVAIAAVPAAAQDRGLLVNAAASGRRIALVIGNAAYKEAPLRNSVNDATSIARTLESLRFDIVRLAVNTTGVALNREVSQFADLVKPGDVAIIYYSGHGMQIGGENYLLPIDFQAQDEAEARYRGYSAGLIHDKLAERRARLKIIILDACRTNPFRMTRSLADGLAPMASVGRGSFIAFAAGPNSTADDNARGQNGLFTTHLIEALSVTGLSLEQVFSRVRQKVDEASQGRQTPWTNSSVVGDFYFHPIPSALTVRLIPASGLAYLNTTSALTQAGRRPAAANGAGPQPVSVELRDLLARNSARLGVSAAFAVDDAGIIWADPSLDITGDATLLLKGTAPIRATPISAFVRAAYVDVQVLASTSMLGKSYANRLVGAAIAERTALQAELQENFQAALTPVLAQVGRAAGADLIFSAADSGLAWINSALDLTSDLARALDAPESSIGSMTGVAPQGPPRVAWINMQQLAAKTKLGTASTARMTKFHKDKDAEVRALPASVDKTKATVAAQGEIDALTKRLRDEFVAVLMPLLDKRARTSGLKLIFSASDSGIVWADSALDLTDAVVKDMDAGFAGGTVRQ